MSDPEELPSDVSLLPRTRRQYPPDPDNPDGLLLPNLLQGDS